MSATAACSSPSPDGPRLAVASGFTDEVLLLDPASGRIVDRRSLDLRPGERDEPHAVAAAPDGRHWYVSVSHGQPTLWKFERAGDRLVGRVELGTPGAGRVGLSPDGTRALVPDYWLGGGGRTSGAVVVRLSDLTLTDTLSLCAAPHDAQFSPDGRWVGVTCPLGDELLLLDGATLQVHRRIRLSPAPGVDASDVPGNPLSRPMNLVWDPAGGRVFVTLMKTGHVVAVDTAGVEIGRIRAGAGAAQLAITPDGRRLVVAAREDGSVSILAAATLEVERVVALPESPHPHGVALSPDGGTAFVTYEGTIRSEGGVVALDIDTGRVLWHSVGGVFTLGIAYLPAFPSR